MSANTDTSGPSQDTGANSAKSESDHVRQAFSELPFDQKLSTLFRIELDLLGDVADTVVSAGSKLADEIVRVCCEPVCSESPDGQPSAS